MTAKSFKAATPPSITLNVYKGAFQQIVTVKKVAKERETHIEKGPRG